MDMDMAKIVLVEDDSEIVKYLSEFLEREGFEVVSFSGQKAVLEYLEQKSSEVDLILLDVSLADGNGFAVCAAVKSETDIPLIFLTASGDEYSTVTGLDLGADDYIGKPFRPRELLSRIRSVLRRSGRVQSVLEYADVRVDTLAGTVWKAGEEIVLSALEYRLLLIFMTNIGIVLTRNRLLEEIWDAAGEFVNDNTLTVYIKRLREKIETNPAEPQVIQTVRGRGYRCG